MQKINCIIIDDSALARNLLERHISQIADFQLIKTFENGVEANIFLQKEAIDLVFCDIEMPKINGIDFIKSIEPKPFVVFTTAYSEYAVEGFELGAVDYLLKPITFERFQIAAKRAAARIFSLNKPEEQDFIFLKSNGKQIKVQFNDILYLQSKSDYMTFFLQDKKITVLERMKKIITQLPNNQFVRIHHSYIVSIHKVHIWHKEKLEIAAIELPISEKYRNTVKAIFK